MLRVGVLCSGGGTNLQALIDAAKAGDLGAEIGLVIASKPDVYALKRAEENGVPAVVIDRSQIKDRAAYTKKVAAALNGQGIGLAVFAGWTVILTNDFFADFKGGSINVHPALLPAFGGKGFYGMKVHEAVLAAGVKVSGATVHFVTEEVDGGAIILQKAVDVRENDTPETLQRRVMEEAEWVILPEAVRLYAQGKLGSVPTIE